MRESVRYDIPPVSLVAANDRTEVYAPGRPVRAVYVRRLQGAASVQLHLGRNGAPITLQAGDGIESMNPPLVAGLYISSAAGGVSAEIVIVQDDESAGVTGPALRVVTGTAATALVVRSSGRTAAAPPVNTVVADSGPLAAGVYDVDFTLCPVGLVDLYFEARDAANAVTLHNLAACCAGAAAVGRVRRLVLAAGERVRVIVGGGAGAGSVGVASVAVFG